MEDVGVLTADFYEKLRYFVVFAIFLIVDCYFVVYFF
jgi:hypothetical protein